MNDFKPDEISVIKRMVLMNYNKAVVEKATPELIIIMVDNGKRCYRFRFMPMGDTFTIMGINPNYEIEVYEAPRDNGISEDWLNKHFNEVMGFITTIADNKHCRIKEQPTSFERDMLPALLKSSFPGVELLGWDKTQFGIDRYQFSLRGKMYKFFYRYSEEKLVLGRPAKVPFLQVSDAWCDRNTFFGYPKETFEKEFLEKLYE